MASRQPSDLLDRLESGDVATRRETARELFELAGREPTALEGRLETLAAGLRVEDPLVRGHVAATLGIASFALAEDDEPAPYLDVLLERLTDPDQSVRQSVLGVLRNRSTDRLWASPAAETDGDRTRELAVVGLVDCLRAERDALRVRAIDRLTASLVADHPVPDSAVATVFERLDDDSVRVRRASATLVAALADAEPALVRPYVDPLTRRLGSAVDDDVRIGVAEALTALDDPNAVPAVADALVALLEGDGRQRGRVIEALESVAGRSAVLAERVFRVFEDQLGTFDPDVRATAATQLAAMAERFPDSATARARTLADFGPEGPFDEAETVSLALLAPEHPGFVGERLADAASELSAGRYDGAVAASVVERVGAANGEALEPAVPAFAGLLAAERRPVRDAGLGLLGATAITRPAAVEPFHEAFLDEIAAVEGQPPAVAVEGLLALALAAPGRVLDRAGDVAALALDLEDADPARRHNAAVALARLAAQDPQRVPSPGGSLVTYLGRNHPDRCWAFDRLAYVPPAEADASGSGFAPSTDPAWPLGVVAADAPSLVDVESVAGLPERLEGDSAARDVALLAAEIHKGERSFVDPLLNRLVGAVGAENDRFAAACLAAIADEDASVVVSRRRELVAAYDRSESPDELAEALELLGVSVSRRREDPAATREATDGGDPHDAREEEDTDTREGDGADGDDADGDGSGGDGRDSAEDADGDGTGTGGGRRRWIPF